MIQTDQSFTEPLEFNKELIQENQDVFEAFFMASRFGDLETIKTLKLSPIDMFQQDDDGNTALHMASANGHQDVVQYLLSQLPKINHENNYLSIKNHRGNTPLHWAAMNGHEEVVSMLIKEGADPHIQNDAQKTPLWEAEFYGKTKVAALLLEHINIVPKDDDEEEEF